MSSKLSRRELLKMTAGLMATGALAWVPDMPEIEGDVMDALEAVPENTVIVLTDDQPFGPYYLDPTVVRKKLPKIIGWDSDGKGIIADD